MRINPPELSQVLSKGLAPWYFLYGPEDFLLQESRELISQKIQALGEVETLHFNVETTPLTDIITQLDQTSLFASTRLILLKIKKLTTAITAFLGELVGKNFPATYFIVQSEQLTSQQQQASWFSTLLQRGVVIGHWPLNNPQFARWIQQKAQHHGIALNSAALQTLIYHTQGNCLAAAQLLQQWALDPTALNGIWEPANLEQQSQFTLNELIAAILSNQTCQVVKILSYFKDTTAVAPQLILWALTQLVNNLLKCLMAAPGSQARCLMQAGIRGPQQALYLQAVKKMQPRILLKSRALLAKADEQLKSGHLRDISQNLLEISLILAGSNLAALTSDFS